MFFIKSKTLFQIASGGAIIAVGLGCYMVRLLENQYKDAEFFQDAMNILEAHPGAVQFLGSPISATNVNFVPSESSEPSSVAEFKAYVKGPKSSGLLYLWAEKIVGEGDKVRVNVNRIELELANDKSKRLLVKSD